MYSTKLQFSERGGIWGGIEFLKDISIQFSITRAHVCTYIETHIQQTTTSAKTTITFVNPSSCPSGSTTTIEHLLDHDCGVFNGHPNPMALRFERSTQIIRTIHQISASDYGVAKDQTIAGETTKSPYSTRVTLTNNYGHHHEFRPPRPPHRN